MTNTPTVQSLSSAAQGDFSGLVDIGDGRKMYLECLGTGSPTVILESGYRNDADIWTAEAEPGATTVFPNVAKFTRVCAYDRPGTVLDGEHVSRSTPVTMPRTAQDLVKDLHTLLQTAKVPGPYVLAAHSFGGLFVRLYASTYPDEVVGMVLVDALAEQVRDYMTADHWKEYVNFGFTQPAPGLERYKELEVLEVDKSFDQMQQAAAASPLRPMPLFVLSQGIPFDLSAYPSIPAGLPGDLDQAWKKAQANLAALTPNAKHVVATKSSHYIQIQQPDLVIGAIHQVVDAVRDSSSWANAAPIGDATATPVSP